MDIEAVGSTGMRLFDGSFSSSSSSSSTGWHVSLFARGFVVDL